MTAPLPVEPIARAWAMYERYGAEYEAHWKSYMDLSDKSGDGWKRGVTSTTLREMDEKLDRLRSAWLGAYDSWNRLVKQEGRLATDVTLSNVDEGDYATIIQDSFAAASEGIQWSLNSGLVAHKLVRALRGFAVREDSQEVPLCSMCA